MTQTQETLERRAKEEQYFRIFKSNPDAADTALRIMAVIAASPESKSIEKTLEFYATIKQSAIDILLAVLRAKN